MVHLPPNQGIDRHGDFNFKQKLVFQFALSYTLKNRFLRAYHVCKWQLHAYP
ncbi:hypothetical protein HanPI659440_Chr01g0001701 [Helianthus annuus]|nr:hypothetical protein HanPI659440_Chr01g0001701 [Helianthus annuus]